MKKVLLALLALLALTGCTMKPFGFAPWVIVLPGGKVNVELVVGNKTEDQRQTLEKLSHPESVATKEVKCAEDKSPGFQPPDMTGK